MADYLAGIVARSMDATPRVRPRVRGLFEPRGLAVADSDGRAEARRDKARGIEQSEESHSLRERPSGKVIRGDTGRVNRRTAPRPTSATEESPGERSERLAA